jgi:DNA-binding XRE family transcriptional regulator
LRSSPLFIPDSFSEPFPYPFNTIAFVHSTARRFATSACTAMAKVHPVSETLSSFIQHAKELYLLLNSSFYFRTHSAPASANIRASGEQTDADSLCSYCFNLRLTGVHGAVIGRYERDEVKPSIEIATQLAEALEVSLDYLVGSTDILLEKSIVNKILDILKLKESDKQHVFALLDAFY